MRLIDQRVTKLNETKTSQLLNLVLEAEKRDEPFFRHLKQCLKWLSGEHWPEIKKDDSNKVVSREDARLTVNLAHAHVRSLVPTIFFRAPTIRALPFNPSQEKSAVAWESLINVYLSRSNYKEVTKEVVLDAVVFPEGWKKIVYHKTADPDIISGEQAIEKYEGADGSLVESITGGPAYESGKSMPTTIRLSPEQVITDDSSRRPDRSRFVALKYRRLISELILDPRYQNARKELEVKAMEMRGDNDGTIPIQHPTMKLGVDPDDDGTILKRSEDEIDIYEVWIYQLVDLKLYKQVVTLSPDIKVPLRQPTAWSELCGPYCHKYPIHKLVYNPIPDKHGQSELGVWWSLQKAMNWSLSRIVGQLNRNKSIYNIYPKNAVKGAQYVLNQLHSSKAAEFIECKQEGAPVVEPVASHSTSRDDWNLIQVLQVLIQQVTGFTQNRRGSAGARTATEASIVEGSAQIKTDEKVDITADFIKSDIEIMIPFIRAFVDKDLVFRLTGDVGPIKWGAFTVSDAAWSPDVEVEVESFRKAVSQERIAAYAQALQFVTAAGPLYGGKIRGDVLLRRLLEELEIPNPQEITNDDVPSEVKQMTEIMRMVFGLGAEVLPTDDHQAELMVLDEFIASDVFGVMQPAIQQEILQHYQQHEEILKQIQSQSQAPSMSMPQALNNGNGNPASEARQETQGDRFPIGNF